jgi:putative oxidoreductase
MTATRPLMSPNTGAALLVLRLTLGIVMLAHGYQKLFVFGFGGITGGFAQMGIPMPGITGPLVALLEFFGGIALIIGLLTRLAALGFVIDMLGAAAFVHLKNGFFLPTGFEFVFMLLGASIAVMLGGAGIASVDGMIADRRAGAGQGVPR